MAYSMSRRASPQSLLPAIGIRQCIDSPPSPIEWSTFTGGSTWHALENSSKSGWSHRSPWNSATASVEPCASDAFAGAGGSW